MTTKDIWTVGAAVFRGGALAAAAVALAACGETSPPARQDGDPPEPTVEIPVALPAPGLPGAAPGSPVATDPGSGPWFEDVTASWGVDHVRSPVNQLRHETPDFMTAPVCIVDVDGEPPLDLFFGRRAADDGGSRLYVGHGPGRYVDETDARGLAGLPDVYGCIAFDQDADGDQDLLLTGLGHVTLLRNQGDRFDTIEPIAESDLLFPKGQFVGAAVGDVDGDLDLDLVIAGNSQWDLDWIERISPCEPIYCEAETGRLEGLPSLLLLADGPDVYLDRTDESARDGLLTGAFTLMVGIVDFDGNGTQDIFVGNDFTREDYVLSRDVDAVDDDGNPRLSFKDIGPELAVYRTHTGAGLNTMGWTSGDLDGDGILDHVITGFEGEQSSVHMSAGDLVLETSPDSGTEARIDSFRWGAMLGDIDLDGDLDLLEATGHVYTDELLDLLELYGPFFDGPEAQPTNFFRNDGTGFLVAEDPEPGDALADRTRGRGIALADLDDDGRLDLVLANSVGPPQILRNVRAAGHWLRIELQGRAPNPEAIGARVEVEQSGRTQLRVKKVGEGYGGSSDPRLHLGFRGRDPVRITVRWPDGGETVVDGVRVDQQITVARD